MSVDFTKLSEKFPVEQLKWRVGRTWVKDNKIGALLFVYISKEVVQDRLDEVCGANGWKVRYKNWHSSSADSTGNYYQSQLCGIAINCGGEWVTKWDGASNTSDMIYDHGGVKGGLTDSFRRAATAWGIGRYLSEATDIYARVHEGGKLSGQHKPRGGGQTQYFKYDPPSIMNLPKCLVSSKEEPQGDTLGGDAAANPPGITFGDWRDTKVHFGKYSGKSLGVLSPDVLDWFKSDWMKQRASIGVSSPEEKDLYDALVAAGGANGEQEPRDEIPF